jgi:quercetin dioxygenase-like cupin family protein
MNNLGKVQSNMPDQLTTNSPYALAPNGGEPMHWFDALVYLKASTPGFGITESTLRPGEEPPVHMHKHEDEWLYVLDGEMIFHVGDEEYPGPAGAFVSFPREIPHTFSIKSSAARFLVMNSPGGFERMFELAPKTPEEAVRAMEAFGVTVVAPHPRNTTVA